MYPNHDTSRDVPCLGYFTARDQSMVESSVTEGRKNTASFLFWSKNKAGGTPGPLPWSRHWGKGKGVPAIKAGVFVFRPPSSKLIR